MVIVVEGADGCGKSTLVNFLRQSLGWRVFSSTGPAKNTAAFNDRVREFLSLDTVICDRHPVVSEEVYGTIRGYVMTDPDLVKRFYASHPLLVYCRNMSPRLNNHVVKAHDTRDHLDLVNKHHKEIVSMYDAWALEHARMFYRIGEDKNEILALVFGAINSNR